MPGVLKISEAASLGLHAMSYLAVRGDSAPISTGEIANVFGISENHLSKVFQRLSREGLVKSTRGPGGGVKIAKPVNKITLLDVYEAIEGPLRPTECLLGRHACEYSMCILGNTISNVEKQVRDMLSVTKLSDLSKKLDTVHLRHIHI